MRALVAFALVGCGGGELPYHSDAGAADAGNATDAGADAAVPEPVLPAPPSLPVSPVPGGLPVLTPCAEGFRAFDLDGDGVQTCLPDPDACPAGDFAEDVPKGKLVVDVRLGIDSLADAIAAAPDGAVLRLSKGSSDEIVDVDRPVTLWGACPSGTTIRTVTLGHGARLHGLAATSVSVAADAQIDAVVLSDVSAEEGADLVVSDCYGGQWAASAGATVEMERSSLTSFLAQGSGASIAASHVVVVDAFAISDESTADVSNLLVGGDAPVSNGGYLIGRNVVGRSLVVSQARADIAQALIGVAAGEGGDAVLVGIDVTFTSLAAHGGAHVSLIRAQVDGLIEVREGQLTATDLTMSGEGGMVGIQAVQGAVDLNRARISGARAAGIRAWGAGAEVSGSDVAVLWTREQGSVGYGIDVEAGAELDLERVYVERSVGAGVAVFGLDTRATLRDVLVEPTLGGAGIAAVDGAAVSIAAFRVSSAEVCGVLVARGGELDIRDGEISATPVGASVQVDPYDLARLRDGVVFRDVDLEVSTEELPVPEPIGGL